MKSNLPRPCHRCEPYGGYHTRVEGKGMERCDCDRGKLLAKGDRIRESYRGMDFDDIRMPKATAAQVKAARQAAEALEDIPGYPRTETSMTFLAEELMAMCRTADQMRWLVRRARRLYRKWPGTRELRSLFCQRFMPKDGFEIHGSDVYPGGIPSERPYVEPNWKQIEASPVISIDQKFQESMKEFAKGFDMPKPKQSKVGNCPDYLIAPRDREEIE